MAPLPYPHRATFLASALTVADGDAALVPYLARLISVVVFDHLVRHPVVTLGDHDDERLSDDDHQLIDIHHPQVEDSIDWFFRVSRRHEVLWLELDLTGATPTALRARRPSSDQPDAWTARPELALSHQLDHCLAQWLRARRLPAVEPLAIFSRADLRAVAERLAATDPQHRVRDRVPPPPPVLAVAFLRALAELSRDDARAIDARILQLDARHPVARRNRYVAGLVDGDVARRDILPLTVEAPMYAKPHLSIWGEPFAADRPIENMGVRHQGIAVSLMPANPYACHNYSLQLAEDERREESYRWADRATVVAPQLGAAHLDCVRRLRQIGRPGQAFAEAQYRCREILDRADAGKLAAGDWQAPHHAQLLVAFCHLDVGRLAEAIELGDAVLDDLPDDPEVQASFAWARKRIAAWKTDPRLLARAYACEGHHRGDAGRVLTGLTRGRITDDDDAMMLIDALCAIGRPDHAETAYWQCAGLPGPAVGTSVLGDGKARLAAARALILTGQLDEAVDQIQIVQLRRGGSRLEAEINRLWRLAAIHPAAAWHQVIERRRARGAPTLAAMVARDVSDFVPEVDPEVARRALGAWVALEIDPLWIAELVGAVPAAAGSAAAIVARLAPPGDATLAAADALVQDWADVVVPPAKDRDAHAAGALLALGLSLANYLVAASGPPTPIAGAYRHIATEALHLVRRARYQVDAGAITAVLRMLDWLGDAPEWLLDTWLLRVERALDLEAEHGAYLDGMIAGLPRIARLIRGDERIGWELRLAHDLARDPSQYEAAAALFARSVRAVEAGGTLRAWSAAAMAAAAPGQLDVHWRAALANPTGTSGPWLRLAHALFSAGHADDGFEAACRGVASATDAQRPRVLSDLAPVWRSATPFDGAAAAARGRVAVAAGDHAAAIPHLAWAAATEPGNAARAHALAAALAQLGRANAAIRVLAAHERTDAPRLVGRALIAAGHAALGVAMLRYASRRFRAADDWARLALAAHAIDDDAVAVQAGRRAIELGTVDRAVLIAFATSLYRLGEFVECEDVARLLVAEAERTDRAGDAPAPGPDARATKLAGLHAMARALAGQGRHIEAHAYAQAADELAPTPGRDGALAAELAETLDRIVAQDAPPIRPSLELSMERLAAADLEAGRFESLVRAVSSPSWGVARIALAACEVRSDDESGIPVAPRALDAAREILARTRGATDPDAVLARTRALRIRDNAFLQIDPPPPLGLRDTPEAFEQAFAQRSRGAGHVPGSVK